MTQNFSFEMLARAPGHMPLLPFQPGRPLDFDLLVKFTPPTYSFAEFGMGRETNTARPKMPARATVSTDQLAGALFDAHYAANVVAAHLSMHLVEEWRDKIFKQVDRLLDPESLETGDKPLNGQSLRTFLRYAIYAGVTAIPSLAMSSSGNLVAAWRHDTRRLTIEFQPQDKCHLVISHISGDDFSIVTFAGAVVSARAFLEREGFPLA